MPKDTRGGQNANRIAKEEKKIMLEMWKVNPHYNDPNSRKKGYSNNCLKCVVAFEMQRRGIDAEAKAGFNRNTSYLQAFDFDNTDYNNFYSSSSRSATSHSEGKVFDYRTGKYKILNPNTLGSGSVNVANNIDKAMAKWGEGSRATLAVKWKGSSWGHVMNVERIGGKTVVYDAQSGKSYNIKSLEVLLRSTVTNHTQLIRLDNLPIKSGFDVNNNNIFTATRRVKRNG